MFDLIVIGAGPGGYVAAIRAAQKGLKTALVESRDIGGTCLNRGCIPTKSLLYSAHYYKQVSSGEAFGMVTERFSFDFDAINKRKMDVVFQLRTGVEQLLEANHVKILQGKGRIKEPNTVVVETDKDSQEIETRNIMIATGSVPRLLPPAMQSLPNVFTSDDALAPDSKFYKRVVIVGGGVIGVEFACIYWDLGCEVTLVETQKNLLPFLDSDISKNLKMLFKKRGIKVLAPAAVQGIRKKGDELICTISQKEVPQEVACDGILVSVGRVPFIEGLLMDGMDIIKDDGGFVVVNENMQTNVPNIYAIGDCNNRCAQLAHVASAQGLNAVNHILGEPTEVNMNAIPNCVYTKPEIATVGISATEAEEKGIEVKVGKYSMSGNSKSIITNEERGFIKLVFDAKTEVIIGAQLMCARATDIVSEMTNAIANRLTVKEITSVMRPHPTYVEGITEAAEDVYGLAIHMTPKRNK